MSTDIRIPRRTWKGLQALQTSITAWCDEHQVALGVGEMAAGAGLIAFGVSTGAIELGSMLVATHAPIVNAQALAGSLGGAGAGGWVGAILGSMGVAAAGTAIGIPGLLVVAGASAIFGLAGYTVGDIVHNLMTPAPDIITLLGSGSLALAGAYLLLRGGRRILSNCNTYEPLNQRILHLASLSAKVIARNREELTRYAAKFLAEPEVRKDAAIASGTTLVFGAIGSAVGSAAAASSVSVIGSSTLGGLMLTIGLVSAPVWPVAVGAAGFGALGLAVYQSILNRKGT